MIQFGVDTLIQERLADLAGLRVGLVTNAAATTAARLQPLLPARLALQVAGVNLVALFAPEHGLDASAADGAPIGDARDARTGLPVFSLYGGAFRPTAGMLRGLDLLLFDIPDVGARFYTYIWTLSYVLEACAEQGIPLWVLDRPNPLGGDLRLAEGPMLDEARVTSFVGRWSMPIRHSLTAGELSLLWNHERQLGATLTVIPVRGWGRKQSWPELGLPFVPTSPGVPSYETALLYPGLCLFEGVNVNEGRGTALPFQQIGAPWLDGDALAATFNGLALPGVRARAVNFAPCAGRYAGENCCGVMLHVLDASQFRPVAAGLHLLAAIIRLYPERLAWLPYPTADSGPGYGHFDRLIGDLTIRTQLAEPKEDRTQDIAAWTAASGWRARVQPYLRYDAYSP